MDEWMDIMVRYNAKYDPLIDCYCQTSWKRNNLQNISLLLFSLVLTLTSTSLYPSMQVNSFIIVLCSYYSYAFAVLFYCNVQQLNVPWIGPWGQISMWICFANQNCGEAVHVWKPPWDRRIPCLSLVMVPIPGLPHCPWNGPGLENIFLPVAQTQPTVLTQIEHVWTDKLDLNWPSSQITYWFQHSTFHSVGCISTDYILPCPPTPNLPLDCYFHIRGALFSMRHFKEGERSCLASSGFSLVSSLFLLVPGVCTRSSGK